MGGDVSDPGDVDGPVGVGGVGGSGTRVIASMVQSLGYRVGTNLNRAQDDLTFTVLFKRPDFYRDVRGLVPADHPLARSSARAFVGVRTGRRGLTTEVLPMVRASLSLPVDDGQHGVKRVGIRALRRIQRLRRLKKAFGAGGTDASASGPWTWKEPNTLLYLPTLYTFIPGLSYIHVVRNGLAMAKSRNDFQLTNWGPLFGVTDDGRDPQLRQLVYWARVNLAVADFLDGQPRSLVVSHERTVLEPEAVAAEIGAFLGRPPTSRTDEVVAGVRRPDDFDRLYRPPTDDMTEAERADVRRALDRFGYPSTAMA
jgi:hypothetical protein